MTSEALSWATNAALLVAIALQSDSGVPVGESFPGLLRAVLEDDAMTLTDEEIILLVEGTDEGGVPEELAARYPALDAALASFF